MPTVARFDGIKIQFFAREHPPPHFHAAFAEYRAQIDVATLTVIRGSLPPAKLQAVVEWACTRQDALNRAWDAVLAKRLPEMIE